MAYCETYDQECLCAGCLCHSVDDLTGCEKCAECEGAVIEDCDEYVPEDEPLAW